MKVLFVSPVFFAPEYQDGTRKILSNVLKRSSEIEIDYVFFKEENESSHNLKNINLHSVINNTQYKLLKSFLLPLEICKYDINGIRQKIKIMINDNQYDSIIIVGAAFAPLIEYIDAKLYDRTVLLSIDSMSLFWERRCSAEYGIKKIVSYMQKIFWEKIENKYYHKYNSVVFVSDIDLNNVLALDSKIKGKVIVNGVDTEVFYPEKSISTIPNSIIFTGNMNYFPNKKAAQYLIKNIFPLLQARIKDVSLYIVGIGAQNVQANHEQIHCIDYVENLNEYLCKCPVYVSPLFQGSGVKNKILEALSSGRIIVGSPISFEGINGLVDSEHVFCANNSEQFVDVIEKVMEMPEVEKNRIKNNARKFIENGYSWKAISNKYSELFKVKK